MRGGRATWFAVLVVAVGVGAALPYRKQSDPAPSRASSVREMTLAETGLSLRAEATNEAARLLDDPARGSFADRTLQAQPSIGAPAATVPPPPAFEGDYGCRLERFQSADSSAPLEGVPAGEPFSLALGTAAPTPAPATRHHRIVDGDTLPALAQTYLGDATFAERLFAENRDVLSSPELLPIGAVIRIPAVSGAAAERPQPAPLVPIGGAAAALR